MKQENRIETLVLSLYRLYLEEGRVLRNRSIAAAIRPVVGEVHPDTVRNMLRRNGHNADPRPPTLLDRVGEKKLRRVLRLYVTGRMTGKQAGKRLGCSAAVVVYWAEKLGWKKSEA